MSAELEATYRRALRWYPTRWRAANEDAVLGTLLDQAEDDNRTAPAKGELADLRANAVTTRLGPLGRIPAPVRDRVTALAFGLGGGIAIATLVAMVLQKSTSPAFLFAGVPTVGPFLGWGFVFYAAWVLALIAGLIGLTWVARGIACMAIVVAVVLRFTPTNQFFDHAPTTTTLIFVGSLTMLSFIGNPFASARGRLWIAIGTASWAAFIGFTLWYQRVSEGGVAGHTDSFIGPLSQWLYWALPFALILAFVLRSAVRTPWGSAIVVLLVPIALFVLFGWAPRIDDLIDRLTLQGIAIGMICAVYFVPRALKLRIRITRT